MPLLLARPYHDASLAGQGSSVSSAIFAVKRLEAGSDPGGVGNETYTSRYTAATQMILRYDEHGGNL